MAAAFGLAAATIQPVAATPEPSEAVRIVDASKWSQPFLDPPPDDFHYPAYCGEVGAPDPCLQHLRAGISPGWCDAQEGGNILLGMRNPNPEVNGQPEANDAPRTIRVFRDEGDGERHIFQDDGWVYEGKESLMYTHLRPAIYRITITWGTEIVFAQAQRVDMRQCKPVRG